MNETERETKTKTEERTETETTARGSIRSRAPIGKPAHITDAVEPMARNLFETLVKLTLILSIGRFGWRCGCAIDSACALREDFNQVSTTSSRAHIDVAAAEAKWHLQR